MVSSFQPFGCAQDKLRLASREIQPFLPTRATRRAAPTFRGNDAAIGYPSLFLWRATSQTTGGSRMDLTREQQLAMLRSMQTIRRFEERASEDFQAGHIYGVVHCYIGQEAVAVGVCSALTREDQIISTHRGHGHCIAKGADLKRMMAELYGRYTGYCKGKGGSMHIADFGIGMLGANGIVAGGIPIVTGAGLAAQLDGKGRVAVSFFGDGAAS